MKKNIYFVQAGLNYGKAVYLPYASGCLAAYAWQNTIVQENYNLSGFLYRRESIDTIMEKIKDPYLVAFSCYTWTFEYNKALAKKLKAKYPACFMFFGGHNVSDDLTILENYDFVDFLCHGEGEETFLRVLTALVNEESLVDIPNISYRDKKNQLIKNKTAFYNNLNKYPSPYLQGYFDEIIEANPNQEFCGILETNRGCPYKCAYCDWCFSDKIQLFEMDKIKNEIDWLAKNRIEYVFCADANFGIIQRDLEISQKVVEARKRAGYPQLFGACYSKNSDDTVFEISKLFYENKLNKAATLAYQTLDSKALELVNRKNFTLEHFSSLLQRYNKAGIPTYTEMILGLPGETYESFSKGLCKLIEVGQQSALTVYYCQVYCNSLMGSAEYRRKNGIKTRRVPLNNLHASPPQAGEIKEYTDLVVETSTMNREDMTKSIMFCTCLQCFHHIGLLKCFAQYLNQEHSISYYEFYNSLLRYIFSSTGTTLNKVFNDFENLCMDENSGEWTYNDKRFGDYGWFLEEGAYMEFIYAFDDFWVEIMPFLESYKIKKNIFPELLKYQKSIIRLPGMSKVEIELKYDFYNYFISSLTNDRKELKKTKNKLVINIQNPVYNWEDYARVVMLYAKRRGDTIITNDRRNVKIAYLNNSEE